MNVQTRLDPITLRLHGDSDRIPPDRLQQMCVRIGTRMTRTELWLFGSPRVMLWVIRLTVIGFCLLMVAFAAAAILHPVRLGRIAPYLLLLGGCVAFLYLLWIGARRTRSRRVVEIMLEHLRCPHCGYDLRMLPTDPHDGATVCPECGCAWRIEAKPPNTMKTGVRS